MNNLRNTVFAIFFVLLPVYALCAGSKQEAGASSTRGIYLSEMGYIIQPDEIHIDSYISQVDYNYPLPDGEPFNVITATDFKNGTAYVQIGLKGAKTDFDSLPPLNIAFVIDKSGSMLDYDKMEWVKDSFRVFADQVREQDFVSLVVFDTAARVLIPSKRIITYQDKQEFVRTVNSIAAGGGTNVYDGMEKGYAQVAANFSREYINRVICLTDGEHNSGGKDKNDILNLAGRYNSRDITISTIALGASADIPLMIDIAIKGGGSSRFISDHASMVKTFGSELDRLLAPVARMLKMDLALSGNVVLKETWGYEYRVSGNTVHYTLDTLHNGDYETLVAELSLRGGALDSRASVNLGSFSVEYLDASSNRTKKMGPYPLVLDLNAIQNGAVISDPRVKEAEGYIVLGRGLKELGYQVQRINTLQREYNNALRNPSPQPQNYGDDLLTLDGAPSSTSILRNRIIYELDGALYIIDSLSAYLNDISASLGGQHYKSELELLNNYQVSFSRSRGNYTASPVQYDY